MSEHKHVWKIDKTRQHKRPPRVFVVCDCGAKGQGTMAHGYLSVFKVNAPKYVPVLVDVTPEQKEMLKKTGRQSETVRVALYNYFKRVYTTPYKS